MKKFIQQAPRHALNGRRSVSKSKSSPRRLGGFGEKTRSVLYVIGFGFRESRGLPDSQRASNPQIPNTNYKIAPKYCLCFSP